MSDIKVRIYGEFQKKGFKDAEKATTGLERSFKSLAKTFLTVFSAQQITAFGRASVKAFMEDEAAASRLSKTVSNLGLGFEDARIRQFITDLETASGVSDSDLRPAFQALITTTGSVAKSQQLLSTALDVSIGSGQSLTTVAQDLSAAFVGNTRGLRKYNLGLSQTELSAMSFEEIQKRLNDQFAGQNLANLDTYAGKMSLLKIAFDNMQETIGKGLLDAFQILGGDQGIGGTTTAMERFGDVVANTTRGVAELVAAFKDVRTYGTTVIDLIKSIDPFNPFGSAIGYVQNLGKAKPKPFSTPMTISGSLDSQNKIEAARRKAEAEAAKRAKELLALTKKQVKAQEALNKKKKEDGILGEISKRFDLERIQLAAALGGQINEVEKLRLELMQAILDEDVKRAIILEGQLIKAEAAAAELATLLDSLDTMVGDPFADWPGTINRIQELLKQLNIKIPIETLFAEKGLKLDQTAMTVTKLERMDVDANNVYINGALMGQNQNIVSSSTALSKDAITEFLAGNPVVIAAVEDHADAVLALADAELLLADSLLAESGGNITEIIVNVEGSVISEGDLAETITNIQYEMQRRGQNVLIDSVAI